jgi:hypothetical protein
VTITNSNVNDVGGKVTTISSNLADTNADLATVMEGITRIETGYFQI